MKDLQEISTIYITSSGNIEIPSPIPAQSHLAPFWLVFPESIINTQQICSIEKHKNHIKIYTNDSRCKEIWVTDLDKTWSALQKAFAEGV